MQATQQHIVDLLKGVEGNMNFLSFGTQEFILPGLFIDNVALTFPIVKENIEKIISKAQLAPFGKGLDTHVDKNVRNTYEIDASQISFRNISWHKSLTLIIKKVQEELSLLDVDISAHLYKLLIYEEGSFFKRHKDAEKEPGMFGSLIINLPSEFSGGELLVAFNGKEESIQFSKHLYEYAYAAFFTDCDHEVLKIKSGYKVSLVYNLVQTDNSLKLNTSEQTKIIESVAKAFHDLSTRPNDKPMLFLLDHQYTSKNYARNTLKASDMLRVNVLEEAAKKAGYFINYGLLVHRIVGDIEYEDYDLYRNQQYDEDINPDDYTIGDEIDEEIYVHNWVSDAWPSLGDRSIEDFEIINPRKYTDEQALESSIDGYLGNAGVTVEYLYHIGAVALTPVSKLPSIIQILDNEAIIHWIGLCNNNNKWGIDHDMLINAFFKKNIEKENITIRNIDIILEMFCLTDNFPHRARLLIVVGASFQNTQSSKTGAHFLHKLARAEFDIVLLHANREFSINIAVEMAKVMLESLNLQSFDHNKLVALETSIAKQMKYIISTKNKHYRPHSDLSIKDLLELIFNIAPIHKLNDSFIEILSTHIDRLQLYSNILPSLKSSPESSYKEKVIDLCIRFIKESASIEPQPYPDFGRPFEYKGSLDGKLELLKDFLLDPNQEQYVYARKQADRNEVENYINSFELDISTTTLKKGSPHQLVLTKNDNSYQKRKANYKEDMNTLQLISRSRKK